MIIGLVGWGDWMDGVVAPCSGQWVIDRIVLSWSTYNILLHITIEYIDSSCVLRRRLMLPCFLYLLLLTVVLHSFGVYRSARM